MVDFDDLLIAAMDGDNEAFSQLIEEHYQKIYNICYRFTADVQLAEDLAQDSVIKIFRNLNSFRREARFSTWVYQVTMNVCRDSFRKRSNNQTVSLDLQYEEGGSVYNIVGEESAEDSYSRKEQSEELRKLVAQLPENFRAVVILREYLDYSYEEIAQREGISIGTVKSRLSRARMMLQEKVQSMWEQNREEYSQIQKRG